MKRNALIGLLIFSIVINCIQAIYYNIDSIVYNPNTKNATNATNMENTQSGRPQITDLVLLPNSKKFGTFHIWTYPKTGLIYDSKKWKENTYRIENLDIEGCVLAVRGGTEGWEIEKQVEINGITYGINEFNTSEEQYGLLIIYISGSDVPKEDGYPVFGAGMKQATIESCRKDIYEVLGTLRYIIGSKDY